MGRDRLHQGLDAGPSGARSRRRPRSRAAKKIPQRINLAFGVVPLPSKEGVRFLDAITSRTFRFARVLSSERTLPCDNLAGRYDCYVRWPCTRDSNAAGVARILDPRR